MSSRATSAYCAGEYRHAVVAARLARSASDEGYAAEEAAHVDLWDDFAAALEADLDRAPRAETSACRRVERHRCRGRGRALRDRVGAAGHLAHEARGPDTLVRLRAEDEGHALLRVHSERDHEHAELSRRVLERADSGDVDRIVAAAERALRGNWELLDGVERFAGSRS